MLYNKCYACVRWNDSVSQSFELLCGVRQGGVLSPILFTLYVDDVILKLRAANLGCSLQNVYVGCIMYADDLVLITSSLCTLQAMINICTQEISYLDMSLNVAKSSIIRIGKRYKNQCSLIKVGDNLLQFADVVPYLGVNIVSGQHFMLDISVQKSRFYCALNGILSKCRGVMNETVTLRLINTYCRPLLLYGCDCVPLCKSYVNSLSHSWNRIYWKLFNVNDHECISEIQSYLNDISISDDILKRRTGFINRVKCSNNTVMSLLASFV